MNRKKILFVCTGNTCRSPMAAYMMNDIAVKENLDILIDSAGIFAQDGAEATDTAVRVMSERGIDMSGHRTKQATADLLDAADIILTMTEGQKMILEPMAKGKVFTLKEYALSSGDIKDPYGGREDEYRETAHEISDALTGVVKRLTGE